MGSGDEKGFGGAVCVLLGMFVIWLLSELEWRDKQRRRKGGKGNERKG